MKSIKYLIWSLALVAGGILTACTEDDTYQPGTPESGAGVGFSSEAKTTFTIANDTFVEVPVLRDNASDALTVSVSATTSSTVLNIPSSVSFAAGEKVAPLTISFDLDEFEYDSTHAVELKLESGANTTAYKPQVVTVSISRPAPWISLGMATYTDDFVTTFFNAPNDPYEVEIQENQNVPGFYRLVNPYGEAYPNNDPGDWDESQDYYMEIHAEDPDAVWIPIAPMGFDWGYGEFSMGSVAGMYLSNGNTLEQLKTAGGILGTLQNGVITFPSGQLLISMADYNGGGLYYANNASAFRIVFPGVVVADYSVEAELAGYFTSVSDEYFAVLDVELGEDVEYALAASAAGTDVDALIEAVLAGEADCVEVTASGQVKVPAVEGKNVVVVVTYGGGEPQEVADLAFTFTAGASSPLQKDWTADDMYGIDKSELFKTWIMWGVDWYDETGNTDRQPLTYVKFEESDEDFSDGGEDYDMITVSGLGLGMVRDDSHLWEYYNGFLLNFYMHDNLGLVQLSNGAQYYLNYAAFSSQGTIYGFYDEILVGGLVAEGYMAMAFSEFYNLGGNPAPDGLIYRVYEDDACTTAVGNLEAIYNIMFEDPAISSVTRAHQSKSMTTVSELNMLAKEIATPANYVELRGRERAHAIIDELNAKRATTTPRKVEATITLIEKNFDKSLKSNVGKSAANL